MKVIANCLVPIFLECDVKLTKTNVLRNLCQMVECHLSKQVMRIGQYQWCKNVMTKCLVPIFLECDVRLSITYGL